MSEEHREFLHSQSRLVDRLSDAEKNCDRIIEDASRIKRDAEVLKGDIGKVRSAIETMFNDLLTAGKIILKGGQNG